MQSLFHQVLLKTLRVNFVKITNIEKKVYSKKDKKENVVRFLGLAEEILHLDETNDNLTDEIRDLGQKLDLNVDIDEYSGPMGAALTNEELLESEKVIEVEQNEPIEIDNEKTIEALELIHKGMQLLREADPNITRRVDAQVAVQTAIFPYQTLLGNQK